MSKVEITDEMVERVWRSFSCCTLKARSDVRYVLNAALNPAPQEPEIVVTREMRRAGEELFTRYRNFPKRETDPEREGDIAEIIYGAMKKLEPKAKRSPVVGGYFHHRREFMSDGITPDGGTYHRRKGDPT